ncbi:hypothetical protein KZX50_23085 [Bacillus infantis]|uniref:hypothetical protein n=1 Tax=Bacillus infantis TaxID=324767 RepID=UPI0020030EEA|nr:hypothetical protein [Bacillus infantis]MCK6208321.1 hypothetical protein [Bacillus infantis]
MGGNKQPSILGAMGEIIENKSKLGGKEMIKTRFKKVKTTKFVFCGKTIFYSF